MVTQERHKKLKFDKPKSAGQKAEMAGLNLLPAWVRPEIAAVEEVEASYHVSIRVTPLLLNWLRESRIETLHLPMRLRG